MAASKAMPFRTAAGDGEAAGGKFTGIIQLSSGRFAIIERSHEFTLVPWWWVIDRQLGREVMGVAQGGAMS
jgi:dihydropteroate synthase type 1